MPTETSLFGDLAFFFFFFFLLLLLLLLSLS
jgi:hypothetical protein